MKLINGIRQRFAKTRRPARLALLAAVALTAGVIGVAQPAQAATTTAHYFTINGGGGLYSSDGDGGAYDALVHSSNLYTVAITKLQKITVSSRLHDWAADGKGPILKINFVSATSGGLLETDISFHNTKGTGTDQTFNKSFAWPVDQGNVRVNLYSCNGTSNGKAINCSSVRSFVVN